MIYQLSYDKGAAALKRILITMTSPAIHVLPSLEYTDGHDSLVASNSGTLST
jgi:hypothetical protein